MLGGIDFKPVIDLLTEIRDELRALNAWHREMAAKAEKEKQEMLKQLASAYPSSPIVAKHK